MKLIHRFDVTTIARDEVQSTGLWCIDYKLTSSYYILQVKELAVKLGLRVHMDGARLFNAATALGVPAAQVTQHVDSVTFCLSKVMVLHVSLL